MGVGGMDTMSGERNCSVDHCRGAAITSLDQQALCLNHFLLRSYETLERLDPRAHKISAEPLDLASMRAFIEECSRKALDISLQCQTLTNLQRGRLLDILLWAGDLFLLLRAPQFSFAVPAASAEDQAQAHATSAGL